MLQFEKLCPHEHLLEVEYVVDVGSPEGIDALGIVAHHADVLVLFSQLEDNQLLNGVGVLILIHQDELKPLGIFLADIFVFTEKLVGQREQVIEIHRIGLLATRLIDAEDLRDGRHLLTDIALYEFTVVAIVVGKNQMVLGHRDAVVNRGRFVYLVVKFQFLDNAFHERAGIRLIVDSEVAGISQLFCFDAQDS